MFQYLNNITDGDINSYNSLPFQDNISGGDDKKYKVIYLARYTFDHTLINYLNDRKVKFINLLPQIDNIIVNIISELPNEYSTVEDLRINQAKALSEYVRTKMNDYNVFVFPIHGLFTDFYLFNSELKKILGDSLEFVFFNVPFNVLFECFIDSRARMERYVNIFYFMTWIQHLYRKSENRHSVNVRISTKELKQILLDCKCFFMNEESMNTTINTFFNYYKGGDELTLECFIDPQRFKVKVIDVKDREGITKAFQEIDL